MSSPRTPIATREPRSVKGDWQPCAPASSGNSTSASSENPGPCDTPTGGPELVDADDMVSELINTRRILHDVSNQLSGSTATAKRRIHKNKYHLGRLGDHINNNMREIRKISGNSDENFSDAAKDRKEASAQLNLLGQKMDQQGEWSGRLEERMDLLEENMRRLLKRFSVAAMPSHSFDDGEGGVLVLQVKLPGLSSMSEVELDVSADGFVLSSPLFALELAWPRAVDANGAKAKFLRKSGVLQVTLPGADYF